MAGLWLRLLSSDPPTAVRSCSPPTPKLAGARCISQPGGEASPERPGCADLNALALAGASSAPPRWLSRCGLLLLQTPRISPGQRRGAQSVHPLTAKRTWSLHPTALCGRRGVASASVVSGDRGGVAGVAGPGGLVASSGAACHSAMVAPPWDGPWG